MPGSRQLILTPAAQPTILDLLMAVEIEILEARPPDAGEIADIHLEARRTAMPYLQRPHTDEETRDWFARIVGDRPAACWVARCERQIVGYVLVDGENLDHLYVRPGWQRRGVGLSLLKTPLLERNALRS